MSQRLASIAWLVTIISCCHVLSGQDQKAPASNEANVSTNPFTKPSDIAQGLQNLRTMCSRCHGRNGEGARGPSLITGTFRRVTTDADIIRVISMGIPGTGMPGFGPGWEDGYWPIVAYLRDEGRKNKEQPKPTTGNANRGHELFRQNKCAECHWTGSDGGRRGPDLSRLTATTEYVRRSLVDPDSQIDPSYQSLIALMADGTILTGRRLYEDGHYVLFMDENENLLAVPKDRIAEIYWPSKSLMPSFRDVLTNQDIEDLVAYVLTLQKEPPK